MPEVELLAGNVATFDGARDLIELGVDGVKVGIGPGSICTTRVVTGAGVPQITAVAECARAARERRRPDHRRWRHQVLGRCYQGHRCRRGAVMIGSLFAGTEESPGETMLYQGRTFKSYRGMGSIAAMTAGSGDRYSQNGRRRSIGAPVVGEVRIFANLFPKALKAACLIEDRFQ